ncbi:MAG TPA: LPS export ABC transporter periplasmic protein LptC [Longimicrobiaceae bacterium]
MRSSARVLHLLPAAALAALAACGGGPSGPAIAVDANSNQVTIGMNLKITEAGRLKADLFADTAVTPEGETRSQLKKVRLTFFEPGRAPSKLTSRTGEYDQGNGQMTARGDVVLITQGDKGMRTIKSEELHWDQRADRVWSEKSTTILENGRTLITDGFTSNSAFTNVQGKNGRVEGVQVGNGTVTF